jgi:predicted lipoprotein with Yx(FWY)xxD motif
MRPVDCSHVAGQDVRRRIARPHLAPHDKSNRTRKSAQNIHGLPEYSASIIRLNGTSYKWNETEKMTKRIPMLAAALAATVSLSVHAAPPMAANGMYADSKGMTLYTFDKDPASGPSACTGGCAQAWLAAMADASDKPQGDWTIVPTADGGKQWAYKGKRVYVFSKDTKPGDAKGENFKDVWHTVKQ